MKKRKSRTRTASRERWKLNPLDINEDDLPLEFWRQSRLYTYWARKAANARKDVNDLKDEMNVMEADLKLRISSNPSAFGFDKQPTVPLLEAAVVTHPKYQKAVKRHNAAKHQLDQIQALVDGLKQKKDMLEKDGDFYLAGFFAEPRAKASTEMTKRAARRTL